MIDEVLVGPRVVVRLARPSDAGGLVDLLVRNRAFFERTNPTRPAEQYTPRYWSERLLEIRQNPELSPSLYFVVLTREGERIIGIVNLFGRVGGAFHAATLGYALDEALNGQGLMTEALTLAIRHAFDRLRLHRIMANYWPENLRSARLLRRLGFETEGYAREYLLIGGQWVDHCMTALVNRAWTPLDRETKR